MSDHMHTGFEHFLGVGVMAWLFLNALRIIASWLGRQSGFIGSAGQALGATV